MRPEGWKTIAEAAGLAGYSPGEIRRWARRIRPDGDSTDAGLIPESDRSESMVSLTGLPIRIVKGREIRHRHSGKIIIADSVVAALKAAQEKLQELKSEGWVSEREIAERNGVSIKEVRDAIQRIEKREAKKRKSSGD
jgi:DNA-binding CsgD family transcriptional regulator